jgi:protocatechuate 3,4-dioxygenase beta subunit
VVGLQRGNLDPEEQAGNQALAGSGAPSFFGIVVDADGSPLEGVEVHAYGMVGWADDWNGDPEVLAVDWQTASDEDGAFAFPEVSREGLRFLIEIHHPALADQRIGNQPAYPGASRDLGTLVLGAGFRVHGMVFDAQARPVAGAKVTPFRNHGLFGITARNAIQRSLAEPVATDETGSFEVAGLPTGPLRLQAEAENLIGGWSAALHGTDGALVTGLEIHLREGQVVRGVVLDESQRPISGAHVLAYSSSSGFSTLDDDVTEVLTDLNGGFTLLTPTDLERVTLRVTAEGYRAEEGLFRPAHLEDSIEFRLIAMSPLQGSVVDERESPVAGAQVRLVDAREDGMLLPGIKAYAEGISEGDGSFHLVPNLPLKGPKSFRVIAFVDGSSQGMSEAFEISGSGPRQDEAIRIVLQEGVTVSGKVLGPSGAPVRNALVQLRTLRDGGVGGMFGSAELAPRDGEVRVSGRSAGDGGFRFPGIPAGDYRLEASHPRWSPAFSPEFTLEQDDHHASLKLATGCSIEGSVEGSLNGLTGLVVLASSPGRTTLEVPVDGEGQFLLRNIHPGSWDLALQESGGNASGLAFGWGESRNLSEVLGVAVAAGETVPVVMPLKLEGRVEVFGTAKVNGKASPDFSVFLVPRGNSTAGAQVDWFTPKDSPQRQHMTTTDYNGEFRFSAVEAGDYWLLLCRSGALPGSHTAGGEELPTGLFRKAVTLATEGVTPFDLDVLVGSAGFEVVGEAPRGGPRMTLVPDPQDGRRSHRFLLREGEHMLATLAVGNYHLQVEQAGVTTSQQVHVPAGDHVLVSVMRPALEKDPDRPKGGVEEEWENTPK